MLPQSWSPLSHSLPCLEEKNEEGRRPKDSTPKWLFLSGPPFKKLVVLGLQAFLKVVSCVKLAGCTSRCVVWSSLQVGLLCSVEQASVLCSSHPAGREV